MQPFWFLNRRRRNPDDSLRALQAGAQAALGTGLQAILVFGSSASGEFHQERSDMNVLIVVQNWTLAELAKIRPVLDRWSASEHTVPILLENEEIATYARRLPIEFLDMQQHHRLVMGKNPLEGLSISTDNLRIQCEQELSVKLLKLRQGIALNAEDPKKLTALLAQSISSILTLFRAVLRLEQEVQPGTKLEAGQQLAKKLGADPVDLERIYALRLRRAQDDVAALAGRYVELVEKALHRLSV